MQKKASVVCARAMSDSREAPGTTSGHPCLSWTTSMGWPSSCGAPLLATPLAVSAAFSPPLA
eukprot:634768-Hanusia_phi.AAC.1